jgi:hypothetical protein
MQHKRSFVPITLSDEDTWLYAPIKEAQRLVSLPRTLEDL